MPRVVQRAGTESGKAVPSGREWLRAKLSWADGLDLLRIKNLQLRFCSVLGCDMSQLERWVSEDAAKRMVAFNRLMGQLQERAKRRKDEAKRSVN